MAFRSVSDRVILAAVESTYGTAPTMNAATAILAMNASVRTIADQLAREIDSPFFGGDPFVLVGKRVELDFEVDLLGSATAGNAAPLSAIYRACGHSETLDAGVDATYAPVSTGQASATLDLYWAGVRFRLTGARGSMDVTWDIKNYARARVRMIGLLTIPTDGEAPSGIDLSAFLTPVALETATWSVVVNAGSDYNAHATQLVLNQNATTPLIETSESRQVVWTDRKPGGNLIVVKDAALSTWNPWSIANNHTIVTITSTVTGSGGRNVSTPIRAQLGYPEPTQVDGVAAFNIPFTAIPDAGDDEYSHIFS